MTGWTHGDLLAWYDAKWPDPREAPEVLRVAPDLFDAVIRALEPVYRFCNAQLAEAGLVTIRLRPFGCLTNLVMDPAVTEPTPDTIENAVAKAGAEQ